MTSFGPKSLSFDLKSIIVLKNKIYCKYFALPNANFVHSRLKVGLMKDIELQGWIVLIVL